VRTRLVVFDKSVQPIGGGMTPELPNRRIGYVL
jgi:hypothetical protein